MSVGGIGANRKSFAPLLPGVDHLPHTHDLARNAFSRGEPEHGAELADALERIVALHDASTIAAVIVEPVAGSAGVLIPPRGYLRRLREICDRHGILLIFDEVITGFGRLGTAFAADHFGVQPDLMTLAKGLTNGAVPLSAVLVKDVIYQTFLDQAPPGAIDLFHGYTWSGHPLACAAALATLDLYRDEALFSRAAALSGPWQDAAHALRGAPRVIDIRSIGLVAGIELAPRRGAPGARGMEVYLRCFERGLLVRSTGDTIALSPPLIIAPGEIERTFAILAEVLTQVD
jgi:beta-alanine--pyruvate transaminase